MRVSCDGGDLGMCKGLHQDCNISNGFNGQLPGHNTDRAEWPAKITPLKCDGNDTIPTVWGDASFSIYCGMTICCDSSGPKTDISNHCHSC